MPQRKKKERNLQPHSSWEVIVEPWCVCLCRVPRAPLLSHICFSALLPFASGLEVLHAAKGHGVFFSVVTGTSCVALDKSLNLSGLVFLFSKLNGLE